MRTSLQTPKVLYRITKSERWSINVVFVHFEIPFLFLLGIALLVNNSLIPYPVIFNRKHFIPHRVHNFLYQLVLNLLRVFSYFCCRS